VKSVIESREVATASLRSVRFWADYWMTLRPYLFFVSGSAGLLGLALAPEVPTIAFAAAFFALFVSYGLGQALTDVFQMDTDALSSPYRPLVRGDIGREQVLLVSLGGLFCCAIILAVLNPATLPLSVLAVVGLITYTPFKRRWWGGPFWNSWIMALLPAIGFACGGASLLVIWGNRPLIIATGSVFFSYAVFVLLGYFKDISADRATGYLTLPVVAGWRVAIWTSLAFALAAVGLGALFLLETLQWLDSPAAPGGALAWLWGSGLLLYAHLRMARLSDEADAHKAIGPAVRGFVLMHLGLAAAASPGLLPLVIVLYALFLLVLAGRPDRSQL
jgi:4-hydroxybenzoate polyprenyltransferase